MRTAILLLAFNRPDTTRQVFEAIRKARPPRLYVAADGPRPDCPRDAGLCAEVRRIATAVDWPCEIQTLLQTRNLGCRFGPETGLDWFFDREVEGIILEDDCLPDQTFFRFCEELLERYRGEAKVMMISGHCCHYGDRHDSASYRFSRNVHIWGWATWRRAWQQHQDRELRQWPALRDSPWLLRIGDGHRDFRNCWTAIFDQLRASEGPVTWDYQWRFSCWACDTLTIVPSCNLVKNIGFGEDATHTKDDGGGGGGLPAEAIAFPLVHPTGRERDVAADRWEDIHVYHVRTRAYRAILRRIPGLRWAVSRLRRLQLGAVRSAEHR